MARIQVLDDDDRRRKVGGKAGQHLADGRDPTGRGSHRDDVELGSRKPLGSFRRVEIGPLG